jgi:hypothetical protein
VNEGDYGGLDMGLNERAEHRILIGKPVVK